MVPGSDHHWLWTTQNSSTSFNFSLSLSLTKGNPSLHSVWHCMWTWARQATGLSSSRLCCNEAGRDVMNSGDARALGVVSCKAERTVDVFGRVFLLLHAVHLLELMYKVRVVQPVAYRGTCRSDARSRMLLWRSL